MIITSAATTAIINWEWDVQRFPVREKRLRARIRKLESRLRQRIARRRGK